MKLGNHTYDVMKWICLILLPACAVAYVGLSAVWGWPYADAISKTINIVCTLLGALLGISTAEFNKGK